MGQINSYVEHEHDLFIKWISHVDLNITWTHLASTHDLFINGLVVSRSQVVSDFATPTHRYTFWVGRGALDQGLSLAKKH